MPDLQREETDVAPMDGADDLNRSKDLDRLNEAGPVIDLTMSDPDIDLTLSGDSADGAEQLREGPRHGQQPRLELKQLERPSIKCSRPGVLYVSDQGWPVLVHHPA